MTGSGFLASHLLFWVPLYLIAAVAWTCVGRFMLSLVVPPDSPNYIWRFFVRITEWAVRAARVITPRMIGGRALPLVAAFWLFALRHALALWMLAAGLAPRISAPPAG